MSNHNEHDNTKPVEEALHDIFQKAEPKDEFVRSLEQRLLSSHRPQPQPAWRESLVSWLAVWRPAAAWGLLTMLLIAGIAFSIYRLLPEMLTPGAADPTAVAVAAPTEIAAVPPTAAPRPQPTGNVGYLPDADFINLDEVMILEAPTAQYYLEKGVLVAQAVGWGDRTEVWIERQGDWHNLEGAWLELDDGSRLELRYWNDAANPRQASKSYLQFPPLPEETSQAVLSLPDGWRVPISLVAPSGAAASNLAQGNSTSENCAINKDIRLCVVASVYDLNGAHLLLTVSSEQPGMSVYIPVDTDPPLLDVGDGTIRKAVYDPFSSPYGAPQPASFAQYTVDFRPYTNGSSTASLTIPSVLLQAPVHQAVTITLGSDLREGQTWEVNFPVQIAGQTLIIRRAHVAKSMTGGLQLWLFTDPGFVNEGREIVALHLGETQPALDSYGYGFNKFTREHELVFELDRESGGPVRDQLTFTIDRADVQVNGPYQFQVNLVAGEQLANAASPVVETSGFTPPPPPTPLSMADFLYYGRALRSGEALFVEVAGNLSYLYTMPVEANAPARLLASLPGKIYAAAVIPGGSEIIYVSGEANEDGFIRQARWFRWMVGPEPPLEILGPLSYVSSVKWSADGAYAYYETRDNLSGAPTRRWIFDLKASLPTLIPVPQGVTIFGAVWSLQGHKLALSGYDENTSGQNDVFVLDVNANQLSLVNATRSPNQTEQAVAWSADSSAVVYQAEVEVNTYALYQTNPSTDSTVYLSQMPFYSSSPAVSSDGQSLALAGFRAGQGPDLYHLDVRSGQLTHLTGGASFANLAFSPDSRWLLYSGGSATVQAVELASGNVWILRTLNTEALASGNRITWTGWTP
jgi:hypothetical protein